MKNKGIKEPTFPYHNMVDVQHVNYIKKHICSDEFFHHLMNTFDDIRLTICQSLIEEHHIIETKIENVEYFHELSGGKRLILDVVAKDEQGYFYNVEMQVGTMNEDNYVRFQCYANKLLQKQENRGEKYFNIRDVYQLIICDKLVKELNNYQHDFQMYDYNNEVLLPYHKVHMRIIQLPRIHQNMKKKKLDPIDEIMYLFSTGTKCKEEGCREVDQIMDEYLKYVQSDRFLGDYFAFSREIMEMTMRDEAKEEGQAIGKKEGKKIGIQEGRKVGLKEGLQLGKYELIQKQLYRKYHDDCIWIKKCTVEQLDLISELVIENISLEDLKIKIMINSD